MPAFSIKTKVNGKAEEVFNRFDKELFNYLAPPAWLATLQTYEGNEVGNKVAVQFHFPFKGLLAVEIKENQHKEAAYWFVDEGITLPFKIKKWRHRHAVYAQGPCAIISDEITFETSHPLRNLLYYPILYLAFWGRKKLYKTYFGTCKQLKP